MQHDNWGPHFIATIDASRVLSGKVQLKEDVDEALLRRELDLMGLPGPIVRIMNQWYIRKVGDDTWRQVAASDERTTDFRVHWDSTSVENGDYELLEQMNVFVKAGSQQQVVARTNTVKVAVSN